MRALSVPTVLQFETPIRADLAGPENSAAPSLMLAYQKSRRRRTALGLAGGVGVHGIEVIRHDGLLAPVTKTARLATARLLLAMPQANPRAFEDARDFMCRVAAIDVERCTHCRVGHWCVVEQRNADRAAITAMVPAVAVGRHDPS